MFLAINKKMSILRETFSYLDLPNLLLNIWDYGKCDPQNEIINRYLHWNIEFAFAKWQLDFLYFHETIERIYQNDSAINLGIYSSAARDEILKLLVKKKCILNIYNTMYFKVILTYIYNLFLA